MRTVGGGVPVALLFALAANLSALAQEQAPPPGQELCAPWGGTIPLGAVRPESWNTWVSNTDLKEAFCDSVSVVEVRTRARKNAKGELDVTLRLTTYTKPGHDKKATATIQVLAADRVLQETTIAKIDSEERKYGHGYAYFTLPIDQLPADQEVRLHITLAAVDD
jgi:hypothetical protein